jgi:thymidylate synthase ThyX
VTMSRQPAYWVEAFDDGERERLAPYFTNTDRPVFALRNLPEVVKGALFARYSRSPKSLRRLFLDEFHDQVAGDLPPAAPSVGEARATRLYRRVLDEYGDDSVAQLAGAHVACEQASNLLTKVLEWGRLASYMEQSTRYQSYTDRPGGRWRYHLDPDVDGDPELGPEYRRVLDGVFATYAELVPAMVDHLDRTLRPGPGADEAAWRRALKARALDALRGMLPAATTANLGIFASGQAYEALLIRLRAHPLPEARGYADPLLHELRQVIPSFLERVDRPDRGGAWTRYLAETAGETAKVVDALLGEGGASEEGASVRLVEFDPAGEDKVLTAIAYPLLPVGEAEVAERVARLDAEERARLLSAYVGERTNRRHRPGRAFERAVYTFDVVADYGAFRDLQRHRICTIVWQRLTPDLGYEVPADVADAGLGARYGQSLERLAGLYRALEPRFPAQASYAVSMAHRVRFAITLNARELMHIAELRSSPQGHPTYRSVAQRMHTLIAERAGHHGLATSMRFVVHDDVELGRLAAEQRSQARRSGVLPA